MFHEAVNCLVETEGLLEVQVSHDVMHTATVVISWNWSERRCYY